MYADTGLMFPYFHNLSSDVQPFDDFCPQKFITSLDNLIQSSSISDYDLGGEGDLFKAPEPIIMDQQPLITIDPITSMVSCAQDPQELQVTDIETLKNEEFLNDVFFECKNLLAKEAEAAAAHATKIGTETDSSPLSEVLSFSFPVNTDENMDPSCQIPKSMSCDSLTSMEWIQGAGQQVKFSNFLKNFSEMDFGMRRAYSEGDIKTLSDANYSSSSVNYYPFGHPPLQPLMSEDRMQKLSRYRNKKTKRNFGRKIKYACRKALADSQPRIRGRFAKTETSS